MPSRLENTPDKPTILVVEDNHIQAEITRDFLEKSNYGVLTASNGRSAIKTIKNEPVDLILLDLLLPDLSGNEICRWLKQDDKSKGIPVIMLTAMDSVTDKVAGLEAGADDYLPKPYSEIELNARIYAALRTKALRKEIERKNNELIRKNKLMEDLLHKVQMLSVTDPLTELYNRRFLEESITKELRRRTRFGSPFAILMIDLDRFKSVNDEYGHKIGDSVLVELARRLKRALRELDVLARWGGEEFMALLPGTDKEGALLCARRLLETVSERKFEHLDRPITISVGICQAGSKTDTIEKLINSADSALYRAKENGRNRMEICSDDDMEC